MLRLLRIRSVFVATLGALGVCCAVVAAEPRQFSALELWERKCREGEAAACERAQRARAGAGKLQRLDDLAQGYGARADRAQLEQDDKPLLNLAYKQVMDDFIRSERAAGGEELDYDEETIDYCSEHFHNYWLNKKIWWPTDENGAPDWTDIYYYIVDHYFGVCLRRNFNTL